MIDHEALARAVDAWIQIEPGRELEDTLEAKLDILDRITDVLRFHTQHDSPGLHLRDLLKYGCEVSTRAGGLQLRVTGAGQACLFGSLEEDFTGPLFLQEPLLVFLLAYGTSGDRILDLIRRFTYWHRNRLRVLDFERTKTGVRRIHTNVRLAAGALRSRGLLRYSQVEAYKTWELSLPGILVALELYRDVRRGIDLNQWDWQGKGLSPDVLRHLAFLRNPLGFRKALGELCKVAKVPEDSVIDLVTEAAGLYRKYLDSVVEESDTTRRRRATRAALKEAIEELNKLPVVRRFHEDLREFLRAEERAAILEKHFLTDSVH